MSNEPRKPDYLLKVMRKGTKNRDQGVMGAAWKTKGKFSDFLTIRLHPGAVLDWRMNKDYHISLFPTQIDETEETDE